MKHSVLNVLNYITGDPEPSKAVHGIRSSPAGNHHHRSLPCLWLTLCRKLFFFSESKFDFNGLRDVHFVWKCRCPQIPAY